MNSNLKLYKLKEHLKDLKLTICKILVVIISLTIFSYYFCEDIASILIKPLINYKEQNRNLIFTGLEEAFISYLRLSFINGLILSIPFILSFIYFYIKPALYMKELKKIKLFFILSPLLFIIGILICYYFVIPAAWKFFLTFENSSKINTILEARISEYLSLITSILIVFGVIFQLPLFIIAFCLFDIIKYQSLARIRRFVIALSFILGGIFTPPDILSQIMLAGMIIFLYESSLLILKIIKNNNL